VFRTFVVHNTRAIRKVAESWLDEPLVHVPGVCRTQLFAEYGRLPEEDQELLAAHLTDLTDNAELDDEDEALYTDAATNIPAKFWDDSYLQRHLDKLLPTLATKVSSWHSYLPHVLPGLSQVFTHASPAVLGPALQSLTSTAKAYEDAFDPLHSFFIGRWPSVGQLPSGYAPQTLFAEARQTAVSSPGFVGRHTLASMGSMLADKVVSDTLTTSLVETACVVWQQRPAEAVDFLSSGREELSVSQIADLADAIDYNNAEEVGLLERAWKAMTPNLSVSDDLETTKAVLLKGKRGPTSDPDLILAVWCRALGAEAHSNLKKLMLAAETSDEQRARLLHQIIRDEGRHSERESKEIPALALQLLKTSDSPLTWAAINAFRADVNKTFLTQEERLVYARLLLTELPNGASNTAKGYLAGWAKALGTEAVLKDIKPAGLSEDDVTIINNVFGNSRSMTGLWKRWKNLK
jgi:hypothetical protein